MLITVLLGLVIIYWRGPTLRSRTHLLSWIGVTAGLLFIASGIFIFYQMALALLQVPANALLGIPIIFGSLPIVLGLLTIRSCISPDWTQKLWHLLGLIILSVLALFLWAGWILGPVLLMITAILPALKLLLTRRTAQSQLAPQHHSSLSKSSSS